MMNTDSPRVSDDRSGESSAISPTLDATLDLLSDRRRRYVLYTLRKNGGSATVDELADSVASWERDDDSERAPDSQCVLADLHHNHLPRLADAGVVRVDDETVSLANRDGMPVDEYLDLAAREEDVV